MASSTGIYHGRLMADGQGNLLADESKRVGDRQVQLYDENGDAVLVGGEPLTVSTPVFKYGKNHARPVAFHEGSYVFLSGGDESHNERHHKQFVVVDATTDEDEHHEGVTQDDPHYDADTDNNTRLRFQPDTVSKTFTGHTDAYSEGNTGGDEDDA